MTDTEHWGHYRIERPLGSGGMGTVFAAWDELLDRPVALKLLHTGREEELIEEARAIASLRHPNIVQIYAVERVARRVFAVMERIDGESFDELLRARGALHPSIVVDAVRGVADALTAAHRSGRIHGDVKPSNILRESATGRVMLTDFGLSRSFDEPESGDLMRGTPEYLAPERARGQWVPRELRAAQDVYALAATVFDLLTGRPVFDDPNVREVLRRHAFEEPPRPSQLRPTLSWRVDRAVLSGLRKNPRERTPTPAELALDLASAVRRGHAPPRVLVADDDQDFRQSLGPALAKRLGRVVVESACDGDAAYGAACERAPDLAIVDLDMPGMNGLELIGALRSLPGLDRLPVIVVSGCISTADHDVFGRLGIQHWFDKPVLYWRLASVARELLGFGRERSSGMTSLIRRDAPTLDDATAQDKRRSG